MHDGPRDLIRPDLWAGSLERSLERRRRSRRGSIELGRLRGARELSNPDLLLDSLQHSRARREAVDRSTGLPAPAARGLSIFGLLAAVVAPATGVMATVASAATPTTGQTDATPPTGQAALPAATLAIEGLQTALGLPATGTFDARTLAAVRAFQKAHHLTPDGVVGPATRHALRLPAGPTLTPSATGAPTTARTARTARTVATAVAINPAGGVSAGTTVSTPPVTASIRPARGGAVKAAPVRVPAAAAAPAPAAARARAAKPGPAAPTMSVTTAIRSLQRRLGVATDGHFGPHTRAALRRFQATHRLIVDGVVGPATLNALGLRGATGTALAVVLAKATAAPAVALTPAPVLVPTPTTATLTADVTGTAAATPTAIVATAATGGAAPTAPPSVAAATNPQAPAEIAAMMAAGDRIATLPYIWGGGHASFAAAGYDCSGSVSYVLHAAGLLSTPEDSSGLESYGAAGPGADVTIYANATHTFMVIDGRRFDTIALQQTGTRWSSTIGSTAGYVVRHPIGL